MVCWQDIKIQKRNKKFLTEIRDESIITTYLKRSVGKGAAGVILSAPFFVALQGRSALDEGKLMFVFKKRGRED